MVQSQYRKTKINNQISVNSIITVYRIQMDNKYRQGESHDFPELLYLSRGTADMILDSVKYSLKCGQMLIYAPGTYHILEKAEDAVFRIISFEVSSEILPLYYNRIITLSYEQQELPMKINNTGLTLFRPVIPDDICGDMVLTERSNHFILQKLKIQLELFLLNVCSMELSDEIICNQKDASADLELTEICQYIQDHLSEQMTLEYIAGMFNISVSKLKLLFHRKFDAGVIAYINKQRIIKASELIKNTSLTYTEIAEQLGFGSLHYFSRMFKKETGMSPSEYKNHPY